MKNNFMKKGFAIIMAMTIILGSLTGCLNQEKKDDKKTQESSIELSSDYAFKFNDDGTVVDSAGRTVKLPEKIEKVIPAGPPAQLVIYSLAPEKLAGWVRKPSGETEKYMRGDSLELPVLGGVYGKNADMNLEEAIKTNPDVIIDVGEFKEGLKEDMDLVQEQTGIPTIFIEGEIKSLPNTYKVLGKLLDKEKECNDRAKYISETIEEAELNSKKIREEDRVEVYYGAGEQGISTNSSGSIHADVLKLIGAKNVYEDPTQDDKSWEDISMEQIISWNPKIVLLGRDSDLETISEDPVWQDIDAIKSGKVYKIPDAPYSWMGNPPMINRVIGIKWAGNLLYPELYDYNMVEEAQKFYRLFYHYDLTEDEAKEMLRESTLKDSVIQE